MLHSGSYIVRTEAVLDCVDPGEYASLVDAAKDGLRIILACGTIDMQSGSTSRTRLLQIFPSGITHDAIVGKFTVD